MKLTKEELITKLMAGKKLTPTSYDGYKTYCKYDATLSNPFVIVIENNIHKMSNVWNETEWEVYEEPNKFWEPINGETAYYILTSGIVEVSSEWKTENDTNVINIGNTRRTKEEADKLVAYRKAEYRLRKAVWKLNDGPAPEFVLYERNYTLNIVSNNVDCSTWGSTQTNPDWFYFKSKELSKQLIESHKEDLLIYLHGV